MRNYIFLIIYLCAFVGTGFLAGAQSSSFCDQLILVKDLIATSHFAPKSIDDKMSIAIYDLVLDDINSKKDGWTSNQNQELLKLSSSLDDSILNNDCSFINSFIKIYKSSIESQIIFLESQRSIALDYSGKDRVSTNIRKVKNVPNTEIEKLKSWSQSLRLRILFSISRSNENYEKTAANFMEIEQKTKRRLIEEDLCRLNGLLLGDNYIERVEHSFLNAFLQYHDPHSTFFYTG